MDDLIKKGCPKRLRFITEGIHLISARTVAVNSCNHCAKIVKMFSVVCPVCKNKFYSEEDYFEDNSALHSYCIRREGANHQPKKKPMRTSTPIAELENSPSSFTDSVTDFFYQSWKSGLHSNDTWLSQRFLEPQRHHQQLNMHQVCYTPQLVYFNTVIYQTLAQCPYVQPVGYRPDGTFGVLPTYWSYYGN